MDTLSCVFNPKNERHNEFKPVSDWIDKGKGRIVYGGSQYIAELKEMPNYLYLLKEYEKKIKSLTRMMAGLIKNNRKLRRNLKRSIQNQISMIHTLWQLSLFLDVD